MQGGTGGGGRQFGFGKWTDGDFRDTFTAIISRRGRKNNTYKFAWARFLLDYSHDPGRVERMYERAGATGHPDDDVGAGQVTYA